MEGRVTYEPITELFPHEIFVFGSNLAGRHGKGAAKSAMDNFGAIYGIGVGPQGQSYAIPTKDSWFEVLPLEDIKAYVFVFIQYAKQNPKQIFKVTKIGCGLAGYDPRAIAPLFKNAIDVENIHLPVEFWNVLNYYNEAR